MTGNDGQKIFHALHSFSAAVQPLCSMPLENTMQPTLSVQGWLWSWNIKVEFVTAQNITMMFCKSPSGV